MPLKNELKEDTGPTGKTTDFSNRLGRIIREYANQNRTSETRIEKHQPSPSGSDKTLRLTLLKPLPWLLLLLFLFSFIWDFNGYGMQVFDYQISFEGLLRIVSISGLIGFLTNWAAITMLFRPVKKHPLLMQGLIPAHKERIAHRLAQTVSEELINADLIKERIERTGLIQTLRKQATDSIGDILTRDDFREAFHQWLISWLEEILADPAIRSEISQTVTDEINRNLENRIFEKAAIKLYSRLRGRELEQMIDSALLELPQAVENRSTELGQMLDEFPELIRNSSETIDTLLTEIIHSLVSRFDLYSLIKDNLDSYDEGKLEAMIQGATNEQLKTIQYLGAMLGTIGGFVIWEPLLSLIIIAILGGFLFLADFLLMKYTVTHR